MDDKPEQQMVCVIHNGAQLAFQFRMTIPKSFSVWMDLIKEDKLIITPVEKGGKKYMIIEKAKRIE